MPDRYEIRKLALNHYSLNGVELKQSAFDLAHHIMGLEHAPTDPDRQTPGPDVVMRATRLAKSFGGAVLRLENGKWVIDPLEDGEELSAQQLAKAAVGKIRRGPRPEVEMRPSPSATAKIIAFPQKREP